MRWPWQHEIDRARKEAEQARQAKEAAAVQLRDVESTINESLETVQRLRSHLERNGWTELLQEAWSRG
ncbi:DUF7620 family protein [Gordonia amicalis]|uniref:DUF7620 family protein n=1 Tax=Gordonia amicalis TaxID=89053 RepID=UPI003D2DA1B0